MKCLVVLALIVLVAMVTTEASVCELPIVTGFCRAYFPSWGFSNGECKEFVYGGCGGNDNRFQTKQECADACEYKFEQTQDQIYFKKMF